MQKNIKSGQIPASYPIDHILPELQAAIRERHAVVLQAPPGSGKTTRVPLALLDVIGPEKGRILILEPRRIAAVSAARWMAKTLGEEIGQTLGYSIRFDSRVSKDTRIEVMTEGILTRRILANPDLAGVAMVIFDEFHERSLQTDLALALCLDIRRALREDLKLLVMSATLDGAPVAALLDGAAVITSQGQAYPVEERYCGDNPDQSVTKRMTDVVQRALRETSGDILAFLPGAGEIRAVSNALAETVQDKAISGISLHPLYGDLPFAEQERAILPASHRKIVLATNIAETSLTIEGVRVVIDGGLTRRLQYDPGTGMNRLVTVTVSQAQAMQRLGRAGRLGPGVCYRLYSRHTFQSLIPFAPPEIAISDLSSLVLDLAAWGVKNPDGLSWLDPPPNASFRAASELLMELGALDATGSMTPAGVAMARLPLHPRLGRLLLKAAELHCVLLGADLAALLSERDIIRRSGSSFNDPTGGADLSDRIMLLRQWRQKKNLTGEADLLALRAVDKTSQQLRRLMGKTSEAAEEETGSMIPRLLLSAFPDRIAKRREDEGGRYVLRQGRGARLSAKINQRGSTYIVAPVIDRGEKAEGTLHLVEPLTEELIRETLADQIETRRLVVWDKQEGRIVAALEERLGVITLSARQVNPPEEEVVSALCEAIRSRTARITFSREAQTLQARIRLMQQTFPEENWPDFSDETLLAAPREWLLPWLSGVRSAGQLAALNIGAALTEKLTWDQRRLLNDRAPVTINVPSGHNIPIDYVSGEIPVLAVKLQEMFGLADTPAIAGGRIKLLLHLLSPARRPVQITRDLKAFWNTGYPQVKKELKGRYPKHPWPDDPWNALPTRRTKGRT
ncbi:MAG: ATP-dependent helicase HrpB [Deltaproteobacteria bacterium HGW-Deltaproteobacteria-6]|nr:MAG: ATP-dependent helicase HrpB [Deltaproteobacteria bacterium HGW-Deltaproteobacteria-6]